MTGAAHIMLVVNAPAAAAPSSATINAMSALGPDALSPPCMPDAQIGIMIMRAIAVKCLKQSGKSLEPFWYVQQEGMGPTRACNCESIT